ncbi:MAG TPA: leucyl/phenylalanyl-tRNA--protein transferase [Candidatus Cybelea sp.]|nr:leucyl/phenylalanyl-tRNA--protein transferase [Candidatus Cybelea sp.]
MAVLTPDLLLGAYAQGLFPMAESRGDPEVFWFDPERRGILPLDGFHLPRRLARTVRQGKFQVAIDRDFTAVMAACAAPSPTRAATWINDTIIAAYGALHRRGYAHSVECWRGERLVGGLYGVSLAGAFFGESMFSRETDASKVALVHLIARLRFGGYVLLDAQFLTTHLARFGAIEIPRHQYHARLTAALATRADFHGAPANWPATEVLAAISAARTAK